MSINSAKKEELSNFIREANTKAYYDAIENSKSLGVTFKKVWIGTNIIDKKGNPKTCHLNYAALGFVDMNYEYSPGLKYPYDPDCKDEKEFENCSCTIAFRIVKEKRKQL